MAELEDRDVTHLGRHRSVELFDLLRCFRLMVAGPVFVAVFSFFAPEHAWIEAVSEAFVAYGAVPLAVGFVVRRSGIAIVALLGAVATISMVTAFYLVRPLLDSEIGILYSDLVYWSLVGAVSGALLGLLGWWVRARTAKNPIAWAFGTTLVLALIHVAYALYSGWGRIDVTTASGTTTTGYSTVDVIISSLVLAAFDGAVVSGAIWWGSRDSDSRSGRHERAIK